MHEIERAQQRRLRRVFEHAYRHVPYYRETMDRLRLRPGQFRTAADLSLLPIIDRAQLQHDPEYFVSRAAPLEAHVRLQSGGSTGEPITVYRDAPSMFIGAMTSQRLNNVISGITGRHLRRRREMTIVPLSSSGMTHARAFSGLSLIPVWLRVRRQVLSLLDPPADNIAKLNAFKPHVIGSYGSYLEALFAHVDESGQDLHLPRVVIYASDPLSDSARKLISGRFGVHVISVYQAIESPQIGFECEEHLGLHLNVDLCPVRIVDDSGAELPDGERGEIVISDLTNTGTVLINYKIGDLAAKLTDTCPCGRSLPLLSFLEGRSAEWLAGPAGERIHPQAVKMLLREEPEVWAYQVVQRTPTRFELTLVAASDCDRDQARVRLERKFARQFGRATTTRVTFVDALPRTAEGKVRPVISMVGEAE